MIKVKLDAREVLKDIRDGLDDAALMTKYRLSVTGLQSVLSKLLEIGLVKRADLDKRNPSLEKTVELTTVKYPSCGMPQFSAFDECPHCGVIVKKYLEARQPPKSQPTTIIEKQPQAEPTLTSERKTTESKTVRISAFLWEELKTLGGNPDEHLASAVSMYVLKNKENPPTK
jgi:uncharacterized Zn finger protein (UPF0148 family)